LGVEARARAREAVALDSTFALGWSSLATQLSNWGGTQSAIDSALTQAFRFKDRVATRERDRIIANYYALGPGRDRGKAIAAYEAMIQAGDSASAMIGLGERLRSRREFARAEQLNLIVAERNPQNGTALGNAIEMQVNQGKLKEAAETVRRLQAVSPVYGYARQLVVLYAAGDTAGIRRAIDSAAKAIPNASIPGIAVVIPQALQVRAGRLRDAGYGVALRPTSGARTGGAQTFYGVWTELQVHGRSKAVIARLDSAIAMIPFREMSMVDRPYLDVAAALAQAGSPDKARAMVARYRNEVTDTSLTRVGEGGLHWALAEILLAEGKPREAITEFRLGDVGYDRAPVHECAPCLPFDLARAFDGATMPDSAIAMYERYLATPFWVKYALPLDPVRVPAIHERLGQLYEAQGNAGKSAEHYQKFIELWKNADPELQPRVTAARERLKKLTPVERPGR
jgi:tetratricopeptide (TPR) repeat protein